MKKIKSFEDACKVLNLNPASLPIVTNWPAAHQKHALAHFKLVIIAQALRGDWEPDWNNTDQAKWYPWFNMRAGFAFSTSNFGYRGTHTGVGSRLCFPTKKMADYFGKQFLDLHKDHLTL